MKTDITWRHQNETPAEREQWGLKCALTCEDESLTQQQFTEDADLNVIAKRFGLTDGPMPLAPFDPSHYGDFTNVPDLRTALDLVNDAKEKFMALPARIRSRFDNQPGKMWEFVNDPYNADEAVRLGLLVRPPQTVAETPQSKPEGLESTSTP